MSDLRFSIVIPAYNEQSYLDTSISSALSQVCSPASFEVLVCDSASTDGTQKVIEKYSEIENFRYIRFDDRVSPQENWRRALVHSAGEYVLFLAADDELEDDYLKAISEALGCDVDVDMVICHQYERNEGDVERVLRPAFFDDSFLVPSSEVRDLILRANPFYIGSILFKKENILDPKILRSYNHVYDVELQLCAAKTGNTIYMKKPLLTRLWRQGSLSGRTLNDLVAVVEYYLLKVKEISPQYNYKDSAITKNSVEVVVSSCSRLAIAYAERAEALRDLETASRYLNLAKAFSSSFEIPLHFQNLLLQENEAGSSSSNPMNQDKENVSGPPYPVLNAAIIISNV